MPANQNDSSQYFIPTRTRLRDLDLPSGGKVQVLELDVEDLIGLEILDRMDSLGAIVQKDHIERVKGTRKPTDRPKKKPTKAEQAELDAKAAEEEDKAFIEIVKDKDKFRPLAETIDLVVAFAVQQPLVLNPYEESHKEDGTKLLTKIPVEQRDPDSLYADYLEFEDRMFIFSKVIPSGDALASFREESEKALGDLADESGSGAAT